MDDLRQMISLYKKCRPEVVGLDTETTGLHIIRDTPFVIQWGFYDVSTMTGYTFAVDREKNPSIAEQSVLVIHQIGGLAKYLVGHNVGFDLHMLQNIDLPYPHDNVTDTQSLIRLCSPALTPKKGGERLDLKSYASRHVDSHAKDHEHLLSSERSKIASGYNKILKVQLKANNIPYSEFEAIADNSILDVDDLPPRMRDIYLQWYNTLPEKIRFNMDELLVLSDDIPYNILNRENLMKYAHYDIVYTLEIYYALSQLVDVWFQTDTYHRENKLIMPLFRMERVGFRMDKPYIMHAKAVMKDYILERLENFYVLAGDRISLNQHKRIKEIMNDKYHIAVASSGSEILDQLVLDLKVSDPNNKVIEFIESMQELRTLSKWYVTYLSRFVRQLNKGDSVYTQINASAAVTGRVSSDFQQFPKDAITNNKGEVIFEPRRMVLRGESSAGLLYLDYSQIELRLQAMYTILVGDPDLNLCRAYMPFRCVSKTTGEKYDYKNPDHTARWNSGEWYLEEDPDKHWEPTDVHAATTSKAYPDVDPHSKEFKHLRSVVGKRTNFAKNYGAQRKRIREMFPTFSEDEITRIDAAYYLAFPGVKTYHTYCYTIIQQQGFGTNLFGRRYYGISGHNFINAAIQGSGADFLKQKIIELDAYMREIGCKSKMQMNIHDEISWELVRGEEWLLAEFKRIMQDFPGTLVPIVAESEYSTNAWSEKSPVESVEDIIERNHNDEAQLCTSH